MHLNMSEIFPISDAPSARLMKLKAACLFRAGVLTGPQRHAVTRKADEILHRRQFAQGRQSTPDTKAA